MNITDNDCDLSQLSDFIFSAYCDYSFIDINADDKFGNVSFSIIPKFKTQIDIRFEAGFLQHSTLTNEQIIRRNNAKKRYRGVKQKLLLRNYPAIRYAGRSVFASTRERIKGRFTSKKIAMQIPKL